MKLINNYHTHTYRCGHALGTDEEYVLNAIKIGIKELGFTDHIPFKGYSQPRVRMEYDELDDYVSSINHLKEKYKDEIKIYVGFECEYYHELGNYYKEILSEVDYLICGQHFAIGEDGVSYVGFKKDDQTVVVDYVNRVIEAMASGLFKYIAHPDIFLRSYTPRDAFVDEQIRRICKASVKYNIPLEINAEGMKKKVANNGPLEEIYYPYLYFWNIAKEYDIKVIIGADVHVPTDFLADHDKYCYQIAEMFNLNLIDHIDI